MNVFDVMAILNVEFLFKMISDKNIHFYLLKGLSAFYYIIKISLLHYNLKKEVERN